MRKLSVILLLSCLGLSSCLKDPDVEKFVDISDVFEISLHQELGDVRTPQLKLSILEEQDCEEVSINSNLLSTSEDIILVINYIEIPNSCDSDPSFITKKHRLVSQEGTYNFQINLANVPASDGTITFGTSDARMSFNDLEGIRVRDTQIQYIEDDFLWGYVTKSDSTFTLTEIHERLFPEDQDLQFNIGGTPAFYGHFEILESGDIQIFTESSEGNTFYSYYDPENWSIYESAIEAYLASPEGQGSIVRIYNEKGEILGE